MTNKRKDYISWDEFFMGVALTASYRSKDPSSQVGACIVNSDNVIVATGYNGAPKGFIDDENMIWDRVGDFEETKYAYVVHSEANAILNANASVKNCRIYVTLFPCNECAKLISQSGIKEVIYYDNKYKGTPGVNVSEKILKIGGVKITEYKKTNRTVTLPL